MVIKLFQPVCESTADAVREDLLEVAAELLTDAFVDERVDIAYMLKSTT